MMPVIRVGPAAMQTASLAFILALWVGAFIAEREARRRHLRGDEVWTMLTLFLFVTVILARLLFVAQNLDAYVIDWTEIFSLSPNTLVIEYGALGGLAAVAIYVWWKRIPFARFADALAIGILVAWIIFAVGQFLSGDGYGTPTNVPWAIQFLGEMRHPVQLYEAGALLVGLGIIKQIFRPDAREGIVAWFVIAWYGGTHLLIDAFRSDGLLFENGYRIPQVYGFIALMVALWGLMRTATRGLNARIDSND